MDLSFTQEDEAFRAEVRAFLQDKLPARLSDKVRKGQRLTKADMEEWHAILNARGWLANHWPVEWGGTGWSVMQRFIFETEVALAHAPRIVPFGLSMLAPVLIKYGSEAQKKHWLPRILDGTDWWCQGYSEPGAGSDLAALKTSAVREGDHYVVNGQKTWTTLGQYADMIFCLVRTDNKGKKQEGISFLLIDMKTPGVTVRKIDTIDLGHHVNEVFFDNVRVPAENLVGEENKGWTYAKFLLGYERAAGGATGKFVHYLDQLRDLLGRTWEGGRPLSESPSFRKRLARYEVDLAALKALAADQLATSETGAPSLVGAAAVKLRASELQQSILQTMTDALGRHGLAYQSDALWAGWNGELVGPKESAGILYEQLYRRAATIYGGSSEVQRTIIAKSALGL